MQANATKTKWVNVWVVIELAIGMKPNRRLRVERTVRVFSSKEAATMAAPGAAIAKFRIEVTADEPHPRTFPVNRLHGGKLVHA